MDSVRKYHQLALDCMNLAEAAHDPATQGQLLRLAEFCARLANHAESQAISAFRTDHNQVADRLPRCSSHAIFFPQRHLDAPCSLNVRLPASPSGTLQHFRTGPNRAGLGEIA